MVARKICEPILKTAFEGKYLYWLIDQDEVINRCVRPDAIWILAKCIKCEHAGEVRGIPDCKLTMEFKDLSTAVISSANDCVQFAEGTDANNFLKARKDQTFYTMEEARAARDERDYLLHLAAESENEEGETPPTQSEESRPQIGIEQDQQTVSEQ